MRVTTVTTVTTFPRVHTRARTHIPTRIGGDGSDGGDNGEVIGEFLSPPCHHSHPGGDSQQESR